MFRYKLKFDLYFSLIFNRHPFVDCGDFVTWNFANACSGQHSGQVIQDPWFDACPRPISFSCFLFSNLLYFLNYHSWHLMLFGGRKSLPVPCNNVVIKIHVYSYRRVLVVPGPAIQRPGKRNIHNGHSYLFFPIFPCFKHETCINIHVQQVGINTL